MNDSTAPSRRVYRLDKFVVPDAARSKFLNRVRETHALLKTQPGFTQDFLLEQAAEPRTFKLVTPVEWAGPAVTEGARAAVKALHERTDFNPQDFCVHANIGTHRRADR